MIELKIRPCCGWFIAGLILVFLASPLAATTNSSWFARAWQTEDGLPEHTIVGLEQSPDGYLWVATHRSLSRFDGMRFQEFIPSLPAGSSVDQIRAMILDRRGRIWLAKDGGGVDCLEAGEVTHTYSLAGTSPGTPARTMAEDSRGGIWISDGSGSVSRIQDGKVKSFGTQHGLVGQGMCWLAADTRGTLWFSQSGSVGVFQDEHFVTVRTLGQQTARIAQARGGGIWICDGLKLLRFRAGGAVENVSELKPEPALAELVVTALHEDRAGGLWIGTSSGGLFRLDSNGIQSVGTHPNIINILEDLEGNIWVGTRGGGLNRLSPRAVQIVGPSSGLAFAAVQSACEDAEGQLWAVGQNGALACRSNGVWSLVSNQTNLNGGSVSCVGAEARSGVLIGTRDKGLFRSRNGVIAPLPFNPLLTNLIIRSFCPGKNGNLWIAVNSFVVRYRSDDSSLKHFPLPAGASDVRSMVEGTDGDLWMGTTSDGLLLRIHGDSLINETTNILRGPQHIRYMQLTSDGSLWFGFAGTGLGRLKNGQYAQFHTSHGLWDEFISQILPDDSGRLWIGGNRGIFQVALSELETVASGRNSRFRSVVFGRGDGVPNLQAAFGVCPSASQTRDGRLLMPMLTGLAIIEPDVLRKNLLPPPAVVERVMVNGRVVASYDLPREDSSTNNTSLINLHSRPGKLEIGPGVEELKFDFTGLTLAAPENVTFRYQLEGYDPGWQDNGNTRFVRYAKVQPGSYRFRITACNHDGIWNETGSEVVLIVQPHLWQKTWFQVATASFGTFVLAGGILFGVRRKYRRKLERIEQQRALERERSRIAQDLHDDLGAGLVEINFGSELAQDPSLGPDEVREHTREIGARAREMVTALDEIVWAVNPKHDSVSSLATYFCQFAQHFLRATSLRCHLDVARDLPSAPLNAEQRHSLFLAFKEALNNAVRHSRASDLRLKIAANDDMLTIVVNDNGCGIDQISPRERNGSDGLGNMHRRMDQLGGRFELNSIPGQGTTVTFKVPLRDVGRASSP